MSRRNPRYANGNQRRKLRARIKAEAGPCGICKGALGPIHYDEPSDAQHPLSFVVDEILPVSRWQASSSSLLLQPSKGQQTKNNYTEKNNKKRYSTGRRLVKGGGVPPPHPRGAAIGTSAEIPLTRARARRGWS